MSKIEMRRVNCNIPKDLYKLVLDSGFKNDRSFTAELITVLQDIFQDGVRPVQRASAKGKKPTPMDELKAYATMSMEERVDSHMDQSREQHAKWSPNEDFDEEGQRTRWIAKIKREMEAEATQ